MVHLPKNVPGGEIIPPERRRLLRGTKKRVKKRMKAMGNVKVPREAFMAVLKLD